MVNVNEKEETIDLLEVFNLLLSKIWLIVASAVVCALGAFIISNYLITPTYQSRLSLYVFNGESHGKEASNNDLVMAQRLVNSYMAVLQSDKFLNSVIRDVGLDITPEDLSKNIKMSAMKDTELFEILVSASTPNMAFKIANSFVKLAPQGVERIVQTGRTEIVDTPRMAEKPSSPNIFKWVLFGAMVGLLISSGIIIVSDLLDTKIKSKEDITNRYSVPILGSIPLCMEEKKNAKNKK